MEIVKSGRRVAQGAGAGLRRREVGKRQVFALDRLGMALGTLLLAWVSVSPLQAAANGKILTLIANGKPNCVIVAQPDARSGKKGPEGESPLSENVRDFQRILEKMSGARIPIVEPGQAPGDGVTIYVGKVALPKGIVIDEAKIGPRGYCILAAEKALVLRGKTEGGTINALYGFLQERLGVRWFFPTELFEVVPQRPTVVIPWGTEICNPSFEYGVFAANSGVNPEGARWCERMRRDEGAFRVRADPHYLGYILDSAIYGKTHPEYYPLLNGQRVIPAPGDRSAPQPCLSNPEVVQVVVEFCRRSFTENPDAMSVAIGRNDDTRWCECDKCRAMDFLPLEKVNDMEQHSDRYFAFANQVAREVAKTHPDKLIGCLVYNDTFVLPKHLDRIEPNIAIALCVDDSQYYDRAYRARDYEVLESWKKMGCRHIIVYDYPGLCWWWAPRYYPLLNAAHFKEMAHRGIVGWYGGFSGYWATQGPMFYLAAQQMWNVELDPRKVLDEFFTGAFGRDAGREVAAFYGVFEKAWMRANPGRSGKYFEGWSSVREQMAAYRLTDLDQALKHLARAKELAKDDLSRQRIAYLDDNFSYAALAMRGWLTSDAIDRIDQEGLASAAKAKEMRKLLCQVSQAVNDEEAVYRKTLLVDPISDPEGKDGKTGHFGIIRGQWAPRCTYSLTHGTARLLEYYRQNKMPAETASLRKELPADILNAAEAMSAESLGEELIQNGDMEQGTPPAGWQTSAATVSAVPDSHAGKQSLKISATAGQGGAVQVVAVKPDTKYRLDFWYKCSRPGGLYVYVNANDKANSYGESKEDTAWTHLSATFRTPKKPAATTATVGFCSWPGKDTLIDEVSIREVRSANVLECRKAAAGFPDWSQPTFVLNRAEQLGNYGDAAGKWRGADTFSAIACLGWDDAGLHLAVKVKDPDHDQSYSGGDMWNGDGLQFGIDAGADAEKRPFGSGYDAANDSLYGLSLSDRPGSQPELYRWNAPKGKAAGTIPNDGRKHRFGMKMEQDTVWYDFFVSWDELGVTPKIGDKIGFNLVVFDRFTKQTDKSAVLTWLQFTPGIAGSEGQSPALWRQFVITGK